MAREKPTTAEQAESFAALIKTAVEKPGTLSDSYSMFHDYSFTNTFYAWAQAIQRDLDMGPIATFKQWKKLGRKVTKGQKAIWMTMPITKMAEDPKDSTKKIVVGQFFTTVPRWYFMSQTAGPDVSVSEKDTVKWNKDQALQKLEIKEEPFSHIDGNCGGYARCNGDKQGTIAVNPVHPHPYRIYFHEMAHILMHSESETVSAEDRPPATIRELEAELVAYICAQTLGLDGAAESRGYIQHWFKSKDIPAASAKAVCETAGKILSAGKEDK
jgi:hypothetical protein